MLYDYRIITDAEWLRADLLDEVRQFGKRFLDIDIVLRLTYDEKLRANIAIGGRAFSYSCDLPYGDALNVKRMTKRFAKHSLYRALSDESGTELPWGSLTGIRPTKLAYAYLANGGSEDGIAGYLSDTFSVRRDRADIVARIVRVQRSVLPADLTGYVDLYVHIPFCNGRVGDRKNKRIHGGERRARAVSICRRRNSFRARRARTRASARSDRLP